MILGGVYISFISINIRKLSMEYRKRFLICRAITKICVNLRIFIFVEDGWIYVKILLDRKERPVNLILRRRKWLCAQLGICVYLLEFSSCISVHL